MALNMDGEYRDGYYVSAEMKKIWKVELDLLREFLDFCQRNGLKCWADGGTLLGAVRHQGFIPWDDDIDLCMLREDYDRMNRIGNSDFHAPYFLQTAYTDVDYFRGHAQFRNSNTTGIRPSDSFQPFNQGIFIDIFVLDGVPEDSETRQRVAKNHKKRLKLLKAKNMNILYSGRLFQIFRKLKARYLVHKHGWATLYGQAEDIVRAQPANASKEVAEITFSGYRHVMSRSLFDETVWLDFEDMKIPAPKRYDEYLKGEIGDDYMTPRMVPNLHGEVVFDTERSYTEWLPEVRKKYKRYLLRRLLKKVGLAKVSEPQYP